MYATETGSGSSGGTGAGDPARRGWLAISGLASGGAGAIHATAVGLHGEHRQAAVAFGLLAVAQLGWGALALLPGRMPAWLLRAGLAANGGAVAGWALAKTAGIGWIDGLEQAEGPGLADTLAAVLAAVAVAGAVLGAVGVGVRLAGGRRTAPVPVAAVVTTAVVLLAMVSAGGHDHAGAAGHAHGEDHDAAAHEDHGHDADAGHDHDAGAGHGHGDDGSDSHDHGADGHGSEAAAGAGHAHPAGTSSGHGHGDHAAGGGHGSDGHGGGAGHDGGHPGGSHPGGGHPGGGHPGSGHPGGGHPGGGHPGGGHPGSGHPGGGHPGGGHPGGGHTPPPYDATLPVDLSGFPGVTPEQEASAEALVTDTIVELPRFADSAAAVAAGYRSVGDSFTGHEHFVNWPLIDDGRILDADHPEALVYRVEGGRRTLVAAMYMLEPGDTLDTVPDVGGPMVQWHVHDDLCFAGEENAWQIGGVVPPPGQCSGGTFRLEIPPMIHVWVVPHECGPFAALEGVGGGQVRPGEEPLCDHVHGS